ncbi:hypothetical protein EVAR_29685_1 [Eumeta japonica]|uniref:Uncharacterized protein n=1 Tax=Eumeta variegata TaxID=151549 RepID=A0A4C1W0N5_EUMVA|nr:hypothetical protein EVAR_29685_1 [Eumeta japonica]
MSAQPVIYRIPAEHRRIVTDSAVSFRPVTKSSGGPLPLPLLYLPSLNLSSIRHLVPRQEAGNALVTPLRMRVSTDALKLSKHPTISLEIQRSSSGGESRKGSLANALCRLSAMLGIEKARRLLIKNSQIDEQIDPRDLIRVRSEWDGYEETSPAMVIPKVCLRVTGGLPVSDHDN